MKRLARIGLLVGLVLVLPRLHSPAVDLENLEPAAAVRVIKTEQGVTVQTDTGASGLGETFAEAVADLRNSASYEIFLDTAEYVLVSGDDVEPAELMEWLRPTCRVCLTDGTGNLEEAASYLAEHPPARTVLQLRGGERLEQKLYWKEGRWFLE